MKRIKVQLGKTINIGDYNSIRIDLGIEQDIKGDNFLSEQEKLFDKLNKKLKKLEKKIKRRK